jgi:hypothetical protein
MFLLVPEQQALQKNQILLLEVLELENLTVERRENPKKTCLKHGFTYSTVDSKQHLQCLICSKILANDSMKLEKLKKYGYKAY